MQFSLTQFIIFNLFDKRKKEIYLNTRENKAIPKSFEVLKFVSGYNKELQKVMKYVIIICNLCVFIVIITSPNAHF